MNIAEFEAIEADEQRCERIASATYYQAGKERQPGFTALWAAVEPEVKAKALAVGLAAIYALVDDYTTRGCGCAYCAGGGERGHGKPLMCSQRWERIPVAQRIDISESIAD